MVQTLRAELFTVVRVCHHASASASVATNTAFHSKGPAGLSALGLENCVLSCHIDIHLVALYFTHSTGQHYGQPLSA
jgi:hypothetical protein